MSGISWFDIVLYFSYRCINRDSYIVYSSNRSEEYIFFFTNNGGNNVISTILWSNEVINIINIYTTNMILRLKLLFYIDEMITSLYYKNIIYNHFSA